jgi:hypothetical protein
MRKSTLCAKKNTVIHTVFCPKVEIYNVGSLVLGPCSYNMLFDSAQDDDLHARTPLGDRPNEGAGVLGDRPRLGRGRDKGDALEAGEAREPDGELGEHARGEDLGVGGDDEVADVVEDVVRADVGVVDEGVQPAVVRGGEDEGHGERRRGGGCQAGGDEGGEGVEVVVRRAGVDPGVEGEVAEGGDGDVHGEEAEVGERGWGEGVRRRRM